MIFLLVLNLQMQEHSVCGGLGTMLLPVLEEDNVRHRLDPKLFGGLRDLLCVHHRKRIHAVARAQEFIYTCPPPQGDCHLTSQDQRRVTHLHSD